MRQTHFLRWYRHDTSCVETPERFCPLQRWKDCFPVRRYTRYHTSEVGFIGPRWDRWLPFLGAYLSDLHIDALSFGQHFSFFLLLIHSKRGQRCPHLCAALWMFGEKVCTIHCAFDFCQRKQLGLDSSLTVKFTHLKVTELCSGSNALTRLHS